MKPEAQRIAIAEALGWKCYPNFKGQDPKSLWNDEVLHNNMAALYPWVSPEGKLKHVLPDYLKDLNVMHEAETTLNESHLWNRYRGWLLTWMTEPIRATAPQRAEAFLRTIGKWVEE